MKKYLVKKTLVAKEDHPWCPNEVQTYIYGRGEKSIPASWLATTYAKELGWGRKRFAEKFLQDDKSYYTENPLKSWDAEWEIIEFDV